jgi:hypothetical protein
MEAAEIEPACEIDATDGIASPCENQHTPCTANALHGSDPDWLDLSSIDVTLRRIINEWDSLPVNMR